MSGRSSRRSGGNSIRGPQSALTDFLASHNISAQQINLDYQARVRDAERQAAQEAAQNAADEDKENEEDEEDSEDQVQKLKRKRKEKKALDKIKASKEFKKRKFEQVKPEHSKPEHSDDDYEEDEEDDLLAREMMRKSKAKAKAPPKPGQFANCEICEKRFTVTPYTLTGSDGGLLCTKCGKELKDTKRKAETAAKKQSAKPVSRARKRQVESDRMMGDVKLGAKSLVEICVHKVANVVNDIEEFGDLPQNLLDRLSQILSKNRVLTPRTLQLFLQPGIDRIAVYDCAKLETEDFQKIFAFMPDVERVNLRFAGQMKDESLRYMIEKNPLIRHLQLGATNLISNAAWVELFELRGPQLETLKLSELNDSMHHDIVEQMSQHCKNLKRIKLRSCPHMTEDTIYSIANMTSLEHVSLAVAQDCSPEALVHLVTNLGPNLKTLSLEDYSDINDDVLFSIRQNCTQLQKLRLTGSQTLSDAALASVFDPSWPNKPISRIDFSSCRDIDNANPDGPEDDPIGFGSASLKALMSHSGGSLETLDLHSCRHIGHDALFEVFDGKKQYPLLRDLDLSFVTHVDEVIMTGIFKSCPALQKLAVFACFSAKEAKIPAGIAVVGLPNAQAQVVLTGDA